MSWIPTGGMPRRRPEQFSTLLGMAIVRIESTDLGILGDLAQTLANVRAAVADALQVPAGDPTVLLVEFPTGHVAMPDGSAEEYVLATVTLFSGRTDQTKRRLFAALTGALTAATDAAPTVDIVLHEVPVENWARDAIPATERDLGFRIDI